jgi:hypothetical protein
MAFDVGYWGDMVLLQSFLQRWSGSRAGMLHFLIGAGNCQEALKKWNFYAASVFVDKAIVVEALWRLERVRKKLWRMWDDLPYVLPQTRTCQRACQCARKFELYFARFKCWDASRTLAACDNAIERSCVQSVRTIVREHADTLAAPGLDFASLVDFAPLLTRALSSGRELVLPLLECGVDLESSLPSVPKALQAPCRQFLRHAKHDMQRVALLELLPPLLAPNLCTICAYLFDDVV